jgi:hypothetical protein
VTTSSHPLSLGEDFVEIVTFGRAFDRAPPKLRQKTHSEVIFWSLGVAKISFEYGIFNSLEQKSMRAIERPGLLVGILLLFAACSSGKTEQDLPKAIPVMVGTVVKGGTCGDSRH